jgi:membrane associated rhomboid family serine protease
MVPEEEMPGEQNVTPEAILATEKQNIRRKAWWGIGIGAGIILLHIIGFLYLFTIADEVRDELGEPLSWKLLFRSIFFILGLMMFAGGIWGLLYARKLTLADLVPSDEAIQFLREGQDTKPYYSMFLIACLVIVTIVQLITENVESLLLIGEVSGPVAGLVKPLVWQGEWWRILTSATLHGFFPLHLYFNSQALFGFGSLIEQLSNRAHLPIVFLIAIVLGGVFSLFFMPNITSIGASGGIMGMIGYMAIFGYKRKRQLPANFLRSMLVNIGFIAAFGLIAYQFIDNFAHLGGLLAGAAYALIQVPSDPHANPRQVGRLTSILSVAGLIFFALVCFLTIVKLAEASSSI